MRISISQHIYKTLTASADLVKVIGKKIYPIATKSEVNFPFIVYERENVNSQYDKFNSVTTRIDVSIYVLSESYSESEELAELVIAALDRKKASYDGYEVLDAVVNDVPESYVNQTFVQQVRMRFIIKEK